MTGAANTADVMSMQRAVSINAIKMFGGWAVKVQKNKKAPTDDWEPASANAAKAAQTLSDVEFSSHNLGIHVFDSVVDIDVDTDNPVLQQALEIFLPHTNHVWGRKSKPRSHRLYKLQGLDSFDPRSYGFLRTLGRTPEINVEARGGQVQRGEMSVMPGSIHPSGEAYTWDSLGSARNTPSMVSLYNLMGGLRKATAAALMVPFWQEGVRQELTMALSGFLYRAADVSKSISEDAFAMNMDEALEFAVHLLELAGDDKADLKARKQAFVKTWKKSEEGAAVTGATRITEITGDENLLRTLYSLLADSPEVAKIEEYLNRFCIWQGPGVVVDLDAVKSGDTKPLMARHAFLNSFGFDHITVGGKRRLLADSLFSMHNTTRIKGLIFEPGEKALVDTAAGKKANQWAGFEIAPSQSKVKDEDVRIFTNYVREVLCSEDEVLYDWVMSWLAHLFQEPGNKCGTALVLVGTPGAGKTFLSEHIIRPIIGMTHSLQVNDIAKIVAKHNTQTACKVFIECDEATNNRQKLTAALLKSLITDKTVLVEPKGVDAYELNNHARFIFTSNDVEDALYLPDGANDRRFTVVEVSDEKVGKIEDYWVPFVKWSKDPVNLGKVHRWLLDYKYDSASIRRPYVTKAKELMSENSWQVFDAWLAEMLNRGHPLDEDVHYNGFDAPQSLDQTKDIDRTEWPQFVTLAALQKDLENFRKLRGPRSGDSLNAQQIKRKLTELKLIDDKVWTKKTRIFSEMKGKIQVKFTLVGTPSKENIAKYLKRKVGFDMSLIDNSVAEGIVTDAIQETDDGDEM